MTPQLSQTGILRAVISADGVLLSADDPLLQLQQAAGGNLGDALLVPQLAAIARLANRLKVALSRPVLVAANDHDVDLWVKAQPGDGVVNISVIDWKERPARAATDGAPFVSDVPEGATGWTFQIDTQMRFVTAALMDGSMPADLPEPGTRIARHLQLIAGAEGDMPILQAVAERCAFDDQLALSVGAAPIAYRISGTPVFDIGGRLLGYRGMAISAVPAEEGAESSETLAAGDMDQQSALFGKRLDRALRRPLSRIIANADTISERLEGPLRDDYAAYAADIASAGRHLMELVDDLADLQAIDRPEFAVAREDVDLADVARRTAGLLSMKAADRGIRIDAPRMDEAMPAIGEFRRVLQVMVNLVGNAMRYSPDGSMVWIRVESIGGAAMVTVADQGRGIAIADQERIFDKFERLGRDEAGGSGLGLYISRRLARAMRGDITVESAPGQGARFTLTLPAA